MKTFQDLIRDGVAPTFVSNWGSSCAHSLVCDPIVTTYNNQFGIANQTHLDTNSEGYCITGAAVADMKHFDIFLHALSYSNISFPCTPMDLFRQYNLAGEYSVQNGQLIYQLRKVEPQPYDPAIGVNVQ